VGVGVAVKPRRWCHHFAWAAMSRWADYLVVPAATWCRHMLNLLARGCLLVFVSQFGWFGYSLAVGGNWNGKVRRGHCSTLSVFHRSMTQVQCAVHLSGSRRCMLSTDVLPFVRPGPWCVLHTSARVAGGRPRVPLQQRNHDRRSRVRLRCGHGLT
jgi:hypothetical protein